MLNLELPLKIVMQRKTKPNKNFYLNQNVFRVTHHAIMSKAKHLYYDLVRQELIRTQQLIVKLKGELVFTYTLYPKSKRRMDLTNSLSAIQKFTDDALVGMNVIADDDYRTIAKVIYLFGSVDKENPRAELRVTRHQDDALKLQTSTQ